MDNSYLYFRIQIHWVLKPNEIQKKEKIIYKKSSMIEQVLGKYFFLLVSCLLYSLCDNTYRHDIYAQVLYDSKTVYMTLKSIEIHKQKKILTIRGK